mgnify:CR=1 FL=1
MRVSTAQIFDNGTTGIQRNQFNLYQVQNQLATGRRIATPADDPIGASQALKVTQSKEVNDQFLENQALAKTQLGLVENKLGSLEDELQSILERAIQAGNGSYSPAQRGMIAEELKRRFENVMSLANSRDAQGLYVFAGFQTNTQPFQVTGTGGNYQIAAPANPYVTYSGDAGVPAVQVSASQSMDITESGLDVFMQVRDGTGALTGRSLFDSLQNLVDILDPASSVPFTTAAYTQAVDDLHASIDHVANRRASVGARLQSLASLTSSGEDVKLLHEQRLSELQDLDYTQAISDLSRLQVQLEASQLSFKQTSQLSLFNIL